MNEGEFINGRNGKVKTIIGSAMHFSLKNNTIPLLTTKKVAWKTCLKELLWFISGSTDNSILQNQKRTSGKSPRTIANPSNELRRRILYSTRNADHHKRCILTLAGFCGGHDGHVWFT